MVRNRSDLSYMIKLQFSDCLRVLELRSLRSLFCGREDGGAYVQLQKYQHYKNQFLSHSWKFCITVKNWRGGYSEWHKRREVKYYPRTARAELSVEFAARTVCNLRGWYTKVW
jgi:hypothetical protein